MVNMPDLGARETAGQVVADTREDKRVLDEHLGLFFPNRVEFVVFDMFLAPFTFSDGGCAVGQRYLLSLGTLVD